MNLITLLFFWFCTFCASVCQMLKREVKLCHMFDVYSPFILSLVLTQSQPTSSNSPSSPQHHTLLLFLLFYWPTSQHREWENEVVFWIKSGSSFSFYFRLPHCTVFILGCSSDTQSSGSLLFLLQGFWRVCIWTLHVDVLTLEFWSGCVWILMHTCRACTTQWCF